MNHNEYYLDIFSGDFQLPSIQQESLLALAYCSLAGINQVQINAKDDLYYSTMPSLRTDLDETIHGAENIIEYFESTLCNSQFVKLSTQHKINFRCYQALLETKLDPCLQYLFWYDEDNYNEYIGRWYAKKSPFPTNFLLPRSLRKQAIRKLESRIPLKILEDDNRVKLIEKKVINDAISCLNTISKKLDDQSFLFGSKPTKIDAYLFSYLALLYRLPVKKEIIKGYIRSTPNLQQYIEQISKLEYFNKFINIAGSNQSGNSTIIQDNYLSFKWSDVLFSGAVAAFLMIYYAFSIGIISTQDGPNYDDEELEDKEQGSE